MQFEPTPAQRAAVEILDQSIVLSAGAGSGKTRVLVQRYLHILRERLAGVEQILAITFTNKAAGEMRERIQKEVTREVLQAPTPAEKEFWRGVKEELHQAQICTFHSFCGQILRQDPLAARIDPYFHTLEELDADELLTDAIEEILLGGLDENDPNLVLLVREFGLYAIEGLLKHAYRQSRGTGLEQMGEITLSQLQSSEELRERLKAELDERVEELFRILHTEKLAAGTRTKLEELERSWPVLREEIAALRSLADPNRQALQRVQEIIKGNVAAAVREPVGRMREILEREWNACLADVRAGELIPPFVDVLRRIDRAYRAKKTARNSLDFADLQEMAIAVLTENPALRNLYHERYRFVMADEFQDTNPTQEQLIRLLIGGGADAPLTGNRLFIVGDPKQSIYRFRGADVTVFKRMRDEITARGGREIIMDTNFRSRGKVIEYVNHFFAQIFGASPNRYDMEYQPSEPHRTCNGDECCVEMLLLDAGELKDEAAESRAEEAVQIALRIQQMVRGEEKLVFESGKGGDTGRPVGYGDICLLFQALTHIGIYEEALQRRNIPYVVVNGRGFFQRQEIRDVLNLLKLVDNRHRQIEWVGVLRSPFVGLSDEELYWLTDGNRSISHAAEDAAGRAGLSAGGQRSLERFLEIYHAARANRDRRGLSGLVRELLQETGYLALVMAHPQCELIRANLDKFITMVRIYEKEPYASLSGLIRYLDGLEDREAREGMAVIPGQSGRVRLMSIHQSKGLEFPVVIIPDTQRTLLNPSNFPAIAFDSELGLGLRVRDPLSGGNVASSTHACIWQEEKLKEIAERKRHFYVAATRARDYLILSGVMGEIKSKEIDEGRSWLEWLGLVFDLKDVAVLPAFLPYGRAGEHRIRISLRQTEEPLSQVAAAAEEVDRAKWSALYRTAGISPVPPEARGYAEYGVTALMTYAQCPRWYFHRYLQHIPDSIAQPLRKPKKPVAEWSWEDLHSGGTPRDGKDPAFFADSREMGNLVHFLFERLETQDELPLLVAKGVRQLGLAHVISGEETEGLAEVVRPYAETFLRREGELRAGLGGEVTDRREMAFQLVSGDALIRGTIDRVLLTSTEAVIIDYKSGQVSPADFAAMQVKYKLQMEIYALALHHLLGRDRLNCKLHWIAPDQYLEQRVDGERLDQIREKVRALTDAIHTATRREMMGQEEPGTYFPCAATADSCPYHHICQYYMLCAGSGKSG